MKTLAEAVALLIVVFVTLALAFLFAGEPDVWDALHARAMAAARK